MASSSSARYDEASEVKPSNSRKAGTGAVVDLTSCKYPSTVEFAGKPSETAARVEHCIKARRPGGEYRKGHGFKTISCSCGGHPCTCGTEAARQHIIHENVNE